MSYQGIHCQKCGKELVPEKSFFFLPVNVYIVTALIICFMCTGNYHRKEGDYATVRKRTVRSFSHEAQHGEGEFPEIYVI
jgi:hypothetical protein